MTLVNVVPATILRHPPTTIGVIGQVTRRVPEKRLVYTSPGLLAGGLETVDRKASSSGIDGIVPRSMRSLREIVDGP